MYVGRYEGYGFADGWGLAPVVTVRGSHNENEQAPLVVSENDLRDYVESQGFAGELSGLLDSTWRSFEIPRGLVDHAVQEAVQSDFLSGDAPENWSPLGPVRPDRLETWAGPPADPQVYGTRGPESGLRRAFWNYGSSGAVVGFREDGMGIGAIGVCLDGFIAPWPSWADSIQVRFEEGVSPGRLPDVSDLLAAAPLGELDELIYWRIYTGDNSWIRDVVTSAKDGAHRLVRAGLEGAGLVVGRVLRVSAGRLDSSKGDPLAGGRRGEAERRNADLARTCSDLDDFVQSVEAAVVVVHGTMSTGLQLAGAISREELTDAGIYVLRYEHDTWLPLERNAQDLAHLVTLRISDRVLFVAHSRGGLLATRAAQILRETHPELVHGVVSLGTPFCGTPLAMGANVGSNALRALLGGLRAVGGPVVDAGSRFLGLALRYDPPPGITIMQPSSAALPPLRAFLHPRTSMIAGDVHMGTADAVGVSLAMQGVGSGAFGMEPHDLVVSVKSALADRARGLVAACDHFSYLDDDEVQGELAVQLGSFVQACSRRPDTDLRW